MPGTSSESLGRTFSLPRLAGAWAVRPFAPPTALSTPAPLTPPHHPRRPGHLHSTPLLSPPARRRGPGSRGGAGRRGPGPERSAAEAAIPARARGRLVASGAESPWPPARSRSARGWLRGTARARDGLSQPRTVADRLRTVSSAPLPAPPRTGSSRRGLGGAVLPLSPPPP